MTSGAAFHLDRGVFKDEGAALFGVALDAGLPVGFLQHGLIVRAVRVVAIRAFHQAFRHAMVRGKSELRLNRGMAAIAELRLCLAQQALGDPPVLLGNSRRAEKLRLRERRLHFVADPGGLGQV